MNRAMVCAAAVVPAAGLMDASGASTAPAATGRYEAAMKLPDGSARNRIYREMYRVLLSYAPSRLGVHRVFSHIFYPWVLGYKKHPILFTSFKYLDIDSAARKAGMQGQF